MDTHAGPVTAIVLAGGMSRRLGRDKLREVVGGCTLLERVLTALRPVCQEIILSVAREPTPTPLPWNVRVVPDLSPGRGVLGGIRSGLVASRTKHSLVVAADMPFLNTDLLRYLVSLAPGYDIVLPSPDGKTEPLHAVYSRDCLEHIVRLLDAGERRIATLFPLVRVRYVEAEELDRLDPRRLSFFNVNTEADLAEARRTAREMGEGGDAT